MNQRTVIALIVIVGVISAVGTITLLMGLNQSTPEVPPPENPPGNEVDVFIGENIELSAKAIFSQDFMPIIGDEGPPFYVLIRVNVTNTGDTVLEDLNAIRTTLYYNGTLTVFTTLNLTHAHQTLLPITVQPGECAIIEFINDRSEVFSPTIDEGTYLYARVLFVYDHGECILTTPPSEVMFTH